MKLAKLAGVALLGCSLQPLSAFAQDNDNDMDVDVDVDTPTVDVDTPDVDIDMSDDELQGTIEDRYGSVEVNFDEDEFDSDTARRELRTYADRDWEERFGTYGTHGQRMISDLEIARRYGWHYTGEEPNYQAEVAMAESRIDDFESMASGYAVTSYGRTIGLTDDEVQEQIRLGQVNVPTGEQVGMTTPQTQDQVYDVDQDTVVYQPVDEDLDEFIEDDVENPFGLESPMDRDVNHDGVVDENDVYDWDGDGIPG